MKIQTILGLLSLIPSIGICIFVYFKDKKEKEPLWLLGSLFLASAALYVPAWLLGNRVIEPLINIPFRQFYSTQGLGGNRWTNVSMKNLFFGLCALIAVALIEELVRWLVLYFFTNKSRHFNCTFDGVVYSIMVSMGALVVHNVKIAIETTWDHFLISFANSFPWYLLFGIVMGVFYSYWHVSKRADKRENALISKGKLKNDKLKYPVGKLILSIVVPVILHAVYSFVIEKMEHTSNWIIAILYIIAGIMMIVSVLLVIMLAKRDTTEREEIERIIEAEHGDLPDEYYEGLEEGKDLVSEDPEEEEAEKTEETEDGEKEEKDGE